jgi:hypothetical protein
MQTDHFVVGLIAAVILIPLGYLGWWHLNYEYQYSEPVQVPGVVTDMKYKRPYVTTSYVSNGKGGGHTQIHHHPAKHYVYINAETIGNFNKNNQMLYKTVRLDDQVVVEYREKYIVEKGKSDKHEFNSIQIDAVIYKNRRVEL